MIDMMYIKSHMNLQASYVHTVYVFILATRCVLH